MTTTRWVCRHGRTTVENCQVCDNDDSTYNAYPNGWHHEEEEPDDDRES